MQEWCIFGGFGIRCFKNVGKVYFGRVGFTVLGMLEWRIWKVGIHCFGNAGMAYPEGRNSLLWECWNGVFVEVGGQCFGNVMHYLGMLKCSIRENWNSAFCKCWNAVFGNVGIQLLGNIEMHHRMWGWNVGNWTLYILRCLECRFWHRRNSIPEGSWNVK